MRRRTAYLMGAAVGMVLAGAARAESVTFVVPDFKGFKNVTVEKTINTWIGVKKKIPFDGTISIGISDQIKVKVTVPVPVFVPTYITVTKSEGEATDPAIGSITLTDIYAVDLQPGLPREEIPLLSGFDPIMPQLQPLSPETFRGISGTLYPATVETVRLADLPTRLPGYDLSYFAQGDPNSIVYLAQTQVPPDDLIKPSAAWVGDISDKWTEAGNWSPAGDPNEPGHRVTFGVDAFPTINPKVQLDVPRTVGEMEFFAGANTTIGGAGGLTLDNGPGIANPKINVFGGSQAILVALNSNGDMDVNVAEGDLDLGGPVVIAGDSGLNLSGAGTLKLSGDVTVGGVTAVKPESTLEVMPGGVLRTRVWRNPGKDIVRGRAIIAEDLIVGDPIPTGIDSFFDIFTEVTVGGMTTVYPGGTLTVRPGGTFRTNGWRNPGKDVVLAGGIAIIDSTLRVEGTGQFEIDGDVTVGGDTLVDPGATLEVRPGGVFRTNSWRNPGKDIVRLGATAQITTDLTVGGSEGTTGGLFDSGGQVGVGGMTAVTPGNTLRVTGGDFKTMRLAGGGAMEVEGGTATLTPKPIAWTANPDGVQEIGALSIGMGVLDLKNNRLDVKYGPGPSPYEDLADAVNRSAITQTTGKPDRTVGIYDTGPASTTGGIVRIGYAAPGDTLLRGQVDSQDIINILASGKYDAGPTNARWDEGDFSHDRQIDSSDIIMLLSAAVYDKGVYDAEAVGPIPESVITGAESAARATIVYDPANGDVKIDPNGNTLSSFRLWDSAANFFVANAVFPAGGAFTTNTAAQKFWSTFNAASYLVATHDLGNIAPTGLTEAQFVAALNNAAGDTVWTAAAGGSFNFNMRYVPEPAASAVLMLGLLLARRRRAA